MTPVIGDILQVVHITQVGTHEALQVHHFRVGGVGATGATDADIANAFGALAASHLAPLMSAQATWVACSCQRISPGVPSLGVSSTTVPFAGNVAGDIMSRQTCGIITKTTDFAGRKYRGRCYVPYPGETDNINPGVPDPTYVVRLKDWADVICLPLTVVNAGRTSSLQPVLFHKRDATYTLITASVSRSRWATQRRRNKK